MDVYFTLKWLHVLAAGLVLGLLAVLPILPFRQPETFADRAVSRHVLAFLHHSTNLVLIPSIIVLVVTGVLMSVGPFALWNMFARSGWWIVLGMGLWAILAGIVGGVLGGLVREMRSVLAQPETAGGEHRMRQLWKQFQWGLAAGVVVTVATFWVMVFQPQF